MSEFYQSLERQRVDTLKSVWVARLKSVVFLGIVIAPIVAMIMLMVHGQPGGRWEGLVSGVIPILQVNMNWVVVACLGWVAIGFWLVGRYIRRNALQPVWDYVADYKTQVFAQLCDEHFPNLSYDPKGYIGYDSFDGMQLFPYDSDWYRSEDYFSGSHGKTNVHFAEVHAKRERSHWQDGRLRKYDETFFQGLVFVADFHKHFHCTARLVPSGEKIPKIRSQKPVTLEDPNFEDCFKTLASDQTDIRYLLSTSMMQRLLRLHSRFVGLRALFSNDRLTLVLPDARDRFEPSLYQRADSSSQLEAMVREIKDLMDVVDELDLNTRIWSRA